MRTPTPEEMHRLRVSTKGFNRALLAEYGIPWPPPSGWRKELLKRFWTPPPTRIIPKPETMEEQLMHELFRVTREKKLNWQKRDDRTYVATISKTQIAFLTRREIVFKTPQGCGHKSYTPHSCDALFSLIREADKSWVDPLESALKNLKAL